jgi:hypothetical protein
VKNQGDLPAYSFTPPYTDGAKLVEPEWFSGLRKNVMKKRRNCWLRPDTAKETADL